MDTKGKQQHQKKLKLITWVVFFITTNWKVQQVDFVGEFVVRVINN